MAACYNYHEILCEFIIGVCNTQQYAVIAYENKYQEDMSGNIISMQVREK